MGGEQSKQNSPSFSIPNNTQNLLNNQYLILSSSLKGFNECFILNRFSCIIDINKLKTNLLQYFYKLLELRNHNMEYLCLSNVKQYYLLYYKIIKQLKSKERFNLYWSLFPDYKCFFSVIIILLRDFEDDNNNISSLLESECIIIDTFITWIENDKDNYSSSLIYESDCNKKKYLLYFFLTNRLPRILPILDNWLYKAFTGKSLVNISYKISYDNCLDILKDYSILSFLSLCIPIQTLYIESENYHQQSNNIDIFKKIKDLQLQWDLIYCSNRDGSGMYSLQESIHGYNASSLILIETTQGEVFGGYIANPLPRNEKQYFSDNRCFLVSILPNLNIYSSRNVTKNYIRFPSISTRNETRIGIGFGGQINYERLWIDGEDNFTKGTKSEMCSTFMTGVLGLSTTDYEIKTLQIYGFGNDKAIKERQEIRDRDEKFIERSKKVDPSAFFGEGQSINENADKKIMEWMNTKRQQ